MPQSVQLLNDLAELKNEIGDTKAKQLNLDILERVIHRMDSYSSDCTICNSFLIEQQGHIRVLKQQQRQPEGINSKEHHRKTRGILPHLKQAHQLVNAGFYTGMYMSLGISVGLMLGLLLFDNIALGLPIGLGTGLAIGASMDAKAKKNGKVI